MQESNMPVSPELVEYSELHLESIAIPEDALETAKATTEWKQEVAPGIFLAVWYASGKKPEVFYAGLDNTDGYKYGVLIDESNTQLQGLDKIVRFLHKGGDHWIEYVSGQIDQNPVLDAADDVFFSHDGDALTLWTSDEKKTPVMLEEFSKTIRGIAAIYSQQMADATKDGKIDYIALYRQLYKDMDGDEATSLYYGNGHSFDHAMGRALRGIQAGINAAAKVYESIRDDYEEPHVQITIDQDNLRVTFAVADYDDEICGPSEDSTEFYAHEVGEAMAEALVLMEKMDEDDSTSIGQATNNWVEDLDLEPFGEFTQDVDIDDAWMHIEY